MKPNGKKLTLAALLIPIGVNAAGDVVTARNPLPRPFFSTDLNSPENVSLARRAADIFIPQGPPGLPTIEIPAAAHGMPDRADELDALSSFPTPFSSLDFSTPPLDFTDGQEVDPRDAERGTTFAIVFSVDRTAIGAVAPEPSLISLGFPFNVQDQAVRRHAAGQAYISLRLFNRSGVIAPPPGLRAADNNTLVYCDNDCGGVDYNVSPTSATPTTTFPPGTPTSDTDAGMGAGDTGSPLRGVLPHARFFFSAKQGSPSLAIPARLPGTVSGADIYIDDQPDSTAGQRLYVPPQQIGLMNSDDINSLIVFDDGDGFFDNGIDQVIFTLRPGSPSLSEMGLGPGDLLTSHGFGVFNVYAFANRLGLLPSDPVDMLDAAPCSNISDCVADWAIGFVCACEGDVNCDGIVDLADLTTMLSAYGTVAGAPGYLPHADFDSNGFIDIADLASLLSAFGRPCT